LSLAVSETIGSDVAAAPGAASALRAAVVERAAALGAVCGVAFTVSHDFDEFLAVNEGNRDSWDPLMPQFHPAHFAARRWRGLWVKAVDRTGRVVATAAARRFDVPTGRTLHDTLMDLSFFYDDPSKARPGERVESAALLPRAVSGSFAIGGALWTHPSARRLNLTPLTSVITQATAHDLWRLPLHVILVEHVAIMRVLGVENMESGIRWTGSYVGPSFGFTLGWWHRDEITRDLTRFAR
jgi:hypothetical protein